MFFSGVVVGVLPGSRRRRGSTRTVDDEEETPPLYFGADQNTNSCMSCHPYPDRPRSLALGGPTYRRALLAVARGIPRCIAYPLNGATSPLTRSPLTPLTMRPRLIASTKAETAPRIHRGPLTGHFWYSHSWAALHSSPIVIVGAGTCSQSRATRAWCRQSRQGTCLTSEPGQPLRIRRSRRRA